MKRVFQTKWVMVILVFIVGISFLGLKVEAGNADLFSLQPGAPGGDAAVVKAWNNENDYDDDKAGWGNIKIYYRGDFFGDQQEIPFSLEDTHATTHGGPFDPTSLDPFAGADGDDKREPVYSFTYFCTAGERSKVSLTEPSATASKYYEVRYSVIIDGQHGGYPDDGLAFTKKDKFIVYGGVMQAWKISSGERDEIRDKSDKQTNPSDISGTRPYGLDDDPECAPPDEMTGKMDIKNYNKLNPAQQQDFSGAVAAAGGGAGNVSGSGGGTSCAGGAMGWLFCPLINYMAKTVQLLAKLVDSLMTVKFLSSESGGKSIEGIWRAVLAVANIMLVIAFMFIILSQSTSAGLSNYGIKRMLPRLIIAAILMNLSFYICAIMIDFSNIIGASVMGFLLGSGNSIQASVTAVTGGGGDTGFLSSAGNTAGTVLAGIGLIALLFFLFTPLILGMLAFFVAIIGRQVVLLVLVLVSPLAFVAWLLPNTEQYFKKWWQLFFQLLMLYPMVMAVFGAALLLSNLIGTTGSDGLNVTGR